MLGNITEDFVQEELMQLKVSQLKKLFAWYGIEYPKGKKEDIVAGLFQTDNIPRSVRIRRIYNGS